MKSYIDELDRNIFNFVEYEGYDDRYPSLSMQAFSSDFYDEIRHASRRLFQIFCKWPQMILHETWICQTI